MIPPPLAHKYLHFRLFLTLLKAPSALPQCASVLHLAPPVPLVVPAELLTCHAQLLDAPSPLDNIVSVSLLAMLDSSLLNCTALLLPSFPAVYDGELPVSISTAGALSF